MTDELRDDLPDEGSAPSAPRNAPDYFINTAPEMDALERAAADGKHGRHYVSNAQLGAVRHVIPGASHHVRLSLLPAEEMAGLTSKALELLSKEQDADAALAFLYIARVLSPPLSQITPEMASGIIDFDDVLDKIGWNPRSTVERREMHRKIYQFILFGERAQVVGKRRGAYKDKHSGDLIDTEISAPLWRIHETEKPEQTSLFPLHEVPVRVELVMSRSWTQLLTSPRTAQYLPMGEMLGAIPGNKPSGAWARVIGLALASFWRRNPREALEGTLKPTRRELLERYPPKTGTATDILKSDKPHRAIDYWCGALQILVEQGFIAPSGDAALTPQQIKASYPRKGWGETWLNAKADIAPGESIQSAVSERSLAVATAKPALRKRGRPKKSTS